MSILRDVQRLFLTATQIMEMCAQSDEVPPSILAERFNVSLATVGKILRGYRERRKCS